MMKLPTWLTEMLAGFADGLRDIFGGKKPEPKPEPKPVESRLFPNPAIGLDPPPPAQKREWFSWKLYANGPHVGREVTVRWPSSLATVHGCTLANCRCFAGNHEMTLHPRIDADNGNSRLTWSTGRTPASFERGLIVWLYKDGKPIAACPISDPAYAWEGRLPNIVEMQG